MIEPETAPSAARLRVHDLGRMAYAEAYAIQKSLQQEVIASRGQGPGPVMHLLLVEHDPPVITVSRRRGAAGHLLAGPDQLARAGVEVMETDRGGDITYHGPGQLVAYPILDLNVLRLRLASYLRFLEAIAITTIARFGMAGHRDETATGVWVGEGPAAGKICAIGVRVSRWVTMHGLALNVTPDLEHFDLIVPCGLAGRRVTSMGAELGAACPPLDAVKDALVAALRSRL